MNKIQK